MQPCSTLADRPTAGPSDRLPLRLIRPARPTRETGRYPGNPSARRDLLTGSPAVYTAFMELRDRPPAVCTYVVMHDRMSKKGDMLVPGSAKKTAAAKISGEQRTPLLPPILILLDCMTCVAREQERLFFSQGQEHSNNANVKTGGSGGVAHPPFSCYPRGGCFFRRPRNQHISIDI